MAQIYFPRWFGGLFQHCSRMTWNLERICLRHCAQLNFSSCLKFSQMIFFLNLQKEIIVPNFRPKSQILCSKIAGKYDFKNVLFCAKISYFYSFNWKKNLEDLESKPRLCLNQFKTYPAPLKTTIETGLLWCFNLILKQGWLYSDFNASLNSNWTLLVLPTATELGNILFLTNNIVT